MQATLRRPMPSYLPRALEPTLSARLESFPVVVLTGARQTGKSTLARMRGGDDRRYRTLDDLDVLEQAREAPDALVMRDRRVTLDEVQREPDLLRAIKRAVDEDREPGRYLLTGSANLVLMGQVSETLAGRAVYLTLYPMTVSETLGHGRVGGWDVLADADPAFWPEHLAGSRLEPDWQWEDHARVGGYPEPATRLRTAGDRAAWFDGYLRTYLERDLQRLSAIDDLVAFQRLVRASALRIGQVVNQAEIARDVGLPSTTAQRYLGLLETSYQIVQLPPYAVSRTKRLVKSPKLYWSDTGLALALTGASDPTGAHLENLLVADLLAWRETRVPRPEVLYWRTYGGAEVDLVVETPSRLVPIEVKSAARVRMADAKHLRIFMEEYPDRAPAGVILYGGGETYWLDDRTLALPIRTMLSPS
ncbi:MAG: ATP-binding protein [Longimicrobiales bacterium]